MKFEKKIDAMCIGCGYYYPPKNEFGYCLECWTEKLTSQQKQLLLSKEPEKQYVEYHIPVYDFKKAMLGGFVGSALFWVFFMYNALVWILICLMRL